jgi:hypothetical protein
MLKNMIYIIFIFIVLMDTGVNAALLSSTVCLSMMTGKNDQNSLGKSYKFNLTTHRNSTLGNVCSYAQKFCCASVTYFARQITF